MTSARLKLLLPALVGLLGLFVLLLGLLRMVRSERSDALWAAQRHEALVASFAKGELTARLENRLARARTEMLKARANPLVACDGCVFEHGGEQLLPRLVPQREHLLHDSVRHWSEALSAGTDHGDSMWAQRITLQAGCRSEEGSQKLARFRASYSLLAEQELASVLAMAEGCVLSSATSALLVHGASEVPGQVRLEGLQQMLLRAAHSLSQEDADYVYERIIQLSRQHSLGARDFSERWKSLAAQKVELPLLGEAGVATAQGMTYYLESEGQERSAIAIDLGLELAAVAQIMRDNELLDAGDGLHAELPVQGLNLGRLAIALRSPRASRRQSEIKDRYHIKLLLLGLCTFLIVLLSVMGVLLQRRRMRILELKSHFIAGVSHELKTPLASMRILAETLQRRTKGMGTVRDYPERLLRDIDGMAFVVENILSFNRITKGRLVPKRELMSLSETLTRAADEVREHSSKEIELSVEEQSLKGDPELLSLLFRNLIANAVAYNRNQVVTIATSSKVLASGRVELRLRDNGVGISEADQRQLFEDFYRGQAGDMAPGSGLGLALCKRIAELHKGRISVEESSSKGTTFLVELA